MNTSDRALTIVIFILVTILVGLEIFDPEPVPAEAEPPATPALIFTPDTIRIDVEGQVFNWGTLTYLGEDTLHLGVFVHESVLPQP